jgi:hypothetical protein
MMLRPPRYWFRRNLPRAALFPPRRWFWVPRNWQPLLLTNEKAAA